MQNSNVRKIWLKVIEFAFTLPRTFIFGKQFPENSCMCFSFRDNAQLGQKWIEFTIRSKVGRIGYDLFYLYLTAIELMNIFLDISKDHY